MPHPEYGLKEKVRYLGLPKDFVAGAVVFGDTDECAVGDTITLEALEGDDAKATTQPDVFGDFEFEGLPANTPYKVTVSAAGYKPQERETRTTKSLYLGKIFLGSRSHP